MKYQLEDLEIFVHTLIDTYETETPHTIIPDFDDKEKALLKKSLSVTKELKSYLFDFDSESRIEALVQCHQATIIELVDLLAGSNHNSSGGSATGRSKNALWKLLNDQLENLLTFIETYFLKYFDQDQKIPNSYLALERTSLSKKTSAIHSIVRTAQLDNRLIDIIF